MSHNQGHDFWLMTQDREKSYRNWTQELSGPYQILVLQSQDWNLVFKTSFVDLARSEKTN